MSFALRALVAPVVGSTAPSWRRFWGPALLVLLVVSTVYLPVLDAGYVWDDDAYVTENADLDDLAGLRRIWMDPRSSPQYYPLVFSTFWVERQIFGHSPLGHHAVNIALHAANVLLVWLVLRRLRVPAALFAALVFAAHPVHVETVAWITERKNVLSGLFCLGALLAYLGFALPEGRTAGTAGRMGKAALEERAPRGRRTALYAVSLVLFVAALLAKTVTAMLPVVMILLVWWKQGEVQRRHWLSVLPLVAVGAAFGILTAWLEVSHVGASGTEWALSPLERVLLAGRVVAFYIGKLLWPTPVLFIYPRWAVDAGAWWQYLFPACTLGGLWGLWRLRSSWGRGPVVAAVVFVVSLFPVLGFLNVYPMRYSWVADHFQYLPSIAFIALAAAAGHAVLGRLGLRRLAPALAAAIVLVLAVAARGETDKFHDRETLWHDTLTKNPQSWIARNNRGNLRMSQGRWAEAAADFAATVALRPDLAEAYNNLGTALFYQGQTELAIQNHRQAISLNPGYAEALNNLGVELASAGRHEEAMRYYRRALKVRPVYPMAHYNLANALIRAGQEEAAESEYREAIRQDPRLAMAQYNLGVRLLARGKRAEAAPFLGEAFRLKPDFAAGYYHVGNILLRQGDAGAAIESYGRALQCQPDYPEAYSNLGAALMRVGRVEQAVAAFRAALRLKPGYAIAEHNLGQALEQQGHLGEALAHLEVAARLDPGNASLRESVERVRQALAKRATEFRQLAGGTRIP